MKSVVDWSGLALLRFFLSWIVLSTHLVVFTDQPSVFSYLFNDFGGKTAVACFLVVSGYSIAASLYRNVDGFYERRFLRVYPLYLTAVIFAATLQFLCEEHLADYHLPSVVNGDYGLPTVIGNVFFMQTFLVKPIAFDGPVWSLAIEVFFYALAPFLLKAKSWYLYVAFLISGISFLLPKHTDLGLVYMIFSKLNALQYFWSWILGFMLFQNKSLFVSCLWIFIGAVLIKLSQHEFLSIATYIITMIAVVISKKVRFPNNFAIVANFLGDLSFPLYLFHFPVFVFIYIFLQSRSESLFIGLSLLVTVLVFYFIDVYLKKIVLAPIVHALFNRGNYSP